MEIPTWVPAACLVIGVMIVLRAALIVATKSTGRFRGDPFITLVLGFVLIYLGQYLLAH